MQWKMARPSRFADGFNRWALRHGFPALLKVAPRLPRWFNLLGARFVITVVMGVYHPPKRAIARNLSRVLGAPAGSHRGGAPRCSGCSTTSPATGWTCSASRNCRPRPRWTLVESATGSERVDAALAAGKGALLLTAHLGNWELGGVFLKHLGRRVSIVYVPDQFRGRSSAAAAAARGDRRRRDSDPAGDMFTSLPALRACARTVCSPAGRSRFQRSRSVWVDFLGRRRLPARSVHAGLDLGAPLLPSFITYTSGQRVRDRDRRADPCREHRQPASRRAAGARGVGGRARAGGEALADAVGTRFYDFWQKERAAQPARGATSRRPPASQPVPGAGE
jgi:lauroyl/myristoyl acyltransferase